MVSVTSEVSANASFQSAAARSARPDSDPPGGNDSFAALVDSNTAASHNDRAQDAAPSPRRSDDAQSASDNRSRDSAAASDKADKAARNDSNNRDAAAKMRDDKTRDDKTLDAGKVDADTNADAETKSAKTGRAKSKSDAPKSEKASSDEATQASSADASPTDQTELAHDGTAVVTADAIAATIPAAATPPATTASAAPATDKATAPLAIAAAAIAASASLAAETAPASPAGESAEATATTTANAAQGDGTKTNAQGIGQAVSAQATSADPSVTTGIAQAASVVAATPAATKSAMPLKSPDLARKGATTVVEQVKPTDAIAPAAPAADTIVPAVTPPTEAAGKLKTENGSAETVKADALGNHIAPSAANANAHFAAPDVVGQTPVNTSGNGLQAAGTIQTQQPAASTTTAAAATQLTATAATSSAVPVSGLAMEIAASAKSGKTRFEIRLDPAELGRIDVRIDVDRHGQVTSHLTVERPETLSMLRQDANQLQRALDNAGLSTGNGGLQFSLRDQSSQGQNDGNQSNPNAHRLVVSEEDNVPAVVAGRSYGRMLGSSGGVDIRV
ncbi:flagellar hook-length control protein FliK [Bradyrhizobium sp. AZCC 1721]|uniref:flagellar hook-length control protein FliK n=1 Tax=Bradyrhizobium sp. AZCC 1721 TaxID=3117016 RepID=UPI002FF431DB